MPLAACCDDPRWRRFVSRRYLLNCGAGVALALGFLDGRGARGGFVRQEATPAAGRVPIVELESVVNGSFVNPLVEVFGDVEIGQRSYVAGNTILYAAERLRVSLGDENNVQDNVYILARERDARFDNMVSVAHHAIIEDAEIGDFTFFGFRCRFATP